MAEKLKCPECGGTHIWKFGFVPLRKRGHVLRYKCVNCARTFYAPEAKKKGGRKKKAS